jgi:imidazole glycerol-phosphate synthase subunit HisF
MLKKRLIAVLIVNNGPVVQSVRFKHTNAIHYDAVHAIESFNKWAIDEIIILNVDRLPESRNKFADIVMHISTECFVPLTAGGWITDEGYAEKLLRSGADKLVLNTAFANDPSFVKRLSDRYGQQCIVGSMDVMLRGDGETTVHVDRGRVDTGKTPANWARFLAENGAGEIFFNSIDHDGARKGYNLPVLSGVCDAVNVPVIAFGGVFTWDHLVQGFHAGAQAAAAANIFHYTEHSTKKAKKALFDHDIKTRKV